MKKSIIYLTLCMIAFSIHAQNSSFHSLELDWGAGILHRQNLSFSSLIHQSVTPFNAQLSYRKAGEWTHEASARFVLYKEATVEPYTFYNDQELQDKSYTVGNQFVLLDVNYGLHKRIYQFGKLQLNSGLRSRNRLQVADYAAGEGTHFSYYFCFGLDASINFKFDISKRSSLESNLHLPLFSFIARNPYAAQDGAYFNASITNRAIPTVIAYIKMGNLESWNNSQIIDYDLAYRYAINENWKIGMKYLLSMNFSQTPKDLNSIENYFYLTIQHQF